MFGEETNSIGQKYQYTKDPSFLTKFLKTMFWIFLGTTLVSMLSDFMQMNLLYADNVTLADADANDNRQQYIAIVYMIINLITVVTFMMWVHRANKNCHGFWAPHMDFSPGWSVGYFFIPFFNLYKPYQVMQEIWKVSTNPRNCSINDGSALVGWWWALCLTSGFLGRIASNSLSRADSASSLKVATGIYILGGFITITLIVVSILLISAIHRKQENLVKNDNVIAGTENC